MKAKKSLGQHFLHNKNILEKIRDIADPKQDDIILEIGPGKGSLTDQLIPLAGKVIAVEKDDRLYEELKEKYQYELKRGLIDLIHGDILDFDPNILKFYKDLEYKIVANIPYNITGAILRKFLSADYQPESMTLLVQKEVAERIIARNGKESILSISVKAYGKPRYRGAVKAGSFAPAPKVDSAIISIEGISKDFFQSANRRITEKAFFELVNCGFHSKRKKLISNLSAIYPKAALADTFSIIGLSENTRAEDVDINTWKKISQILDRC